MYEMINKANNEKELIMSFFLMKRSLLNSASHLSNPTFRMYKQHFPKKARVQNSNRKCPTAYNKSTY